MLNRIKKSVLRDKCIDYGYYGSKTIFIKRWLWWKRLEIANKIFQRYSSKIEKFTIIDFGAEFGFLSAALSRKFKKVYLIEINKKTINKGIYIHNKFGNNNYFPIINEKMYPLTFTKNIKDKVNFFIFLDVLEHIRNLNSFVKGLCLISTENTYFLVSLPTENLLYLTLTKFKREKDHCNKYFEVENVLKKNSINVVTKVNLLFLFNIYLFKFDKKSQR